MSKYLFLYRTKEADDRDCCAYIEKEPRGFECGHYFGQIILHGACYCNSDWGNYDQIDTFLTEDEYNSLLLYNESVSDLGFGIEEGSEKYQLGIALGVAIKPILEKLASEEALEFAKKIQDSEMEFLKDAYNLDDDDIEKIFNSYYQDYKDRSVVGYVFDDYYECGYEEAFSLGYVSPKDEVQKKYFDFEAFGEDLVDECDDYVQLDDGRIAYLMY